MYTYTIKSDNPNKMKIADLKTEIEEISDLLKQSSKKEIDLDKKQEIEMKLRLNKLKSAHSEKTLKEQLLDIGRKEKEKERKTRTHRLVKLGGIIEMYYPNMTEDEMYKLLEFILDQDERGGYASKKIGRSQDAEKIKEVRDKLASGTKKEEPVSYKTEDPEPDSETPNYY